MPNVYKHNELVFMTEQEIADNKRLRSLYRMVDGATVPPPPRIVTVEDIASLLQIFECISHNKSSIKGVAEDMLQMYKEADEKGKRSMTEEGLYIGINQNDFHMAFFDIRSGICSVGLGQLIGYDFWSSIIKCWSQYEKDSNESYPVDGEYEYDSNGRLSLWLNEKRWDLLDHAIYRMRLMVKLLEA